MDQYPLLLLLLDLRKAHNNLDQGRLLQTLVGYGAGLKLRVLLVEFWSRQELVTHQNGFHSPQFRETIDMTLGGLDLPTLFNVSVYSVVRHWLSPIVEDNSSTHDRLGVVVGSCMFF